MTQKRYLKTLLRFLKLGIYNQQTFYNVLYIFTYKRDSSLQQLNAFNFQDEEFEPLAIFFVVLVFYSYTQRSLKVISMYITFHSCVGVLLSSLLWSHTVSVGNFHIDKIGRWIHLPPPFWSCVFKISLRGY